MDQYTTNLERSNKYRFSYLQSFLCQREKNKVIEVHNARSTKILFLPVLSSLASILSLNKNQSKFFSHFCVATLLFAGTAFFVDHSNNESLNKELNKLNRSLPNPVQLQEEYTRDLEIFKRLSNN
jgi:hypothetical protein